MVFKSILPIFAASILPFALAAAWPQPGWAEPGQPRLSGPYSHENLTIYLVHGKSAAGPVPLTLEEALEKRAVTVHETGTVSELAIENTGSEEVLIHAGDIVKGGQQDRVLTTTMILKPKSGKVPLAAFCVEQGRWTARGQEDVKRFASAKEMMPSREAKLAMKAGVKSPPMAAGVRHELLQQAEPAQAADTSNGAQQQVQMRPERMSPSFSAQGEVWKSVAGIQSALTSALGAKVNSEVSESSLQLALENERVLTARKLYLDALQPIAEKEDDVIGYVFAINGKINSADIYASNALFRKLWPRLLKSSATEAMGLRADGAKPVAPETKAVDAFLAEVENGKLSEHEPAKGHKLRVRESASAADFETLGTDGRLVHRNILAH